MTVDFAQRWDEIQPLLDRLFDVPPAERSDWLRRHSADAGLRSLVEQALDRAGSIDMLERDIARALPALADERATVLPPIPGYQVRRFVGSGGIASVFEAQRALPGGAQTVALKLLRINVHDPDERRRFLREQRFLAGLQHPHIAQLLDAGFTSAGTPFLALEFVDGDNIVAHCERFALSTQARLALFGDVCAAVEHAHRNLIVHRDLKPGNVLVGEDGCVKLVDFGIAKLLTGDVEETRTDARRMTRWYAAPEQLAGGIVTTAIDVYALGILLAEIVSGRRFDAGHRPDLAGARAEGQPVFDAPALQREFGFDLWAVVSEATQVNPLRRYATVAALREDVERHLDGRPLRICANAFAYRAVKFLRRNAWAIAASVAVGVALLGAAGISWHEARLAQLAAGNAQSQSRVAESEAKRADVIKAFLEGLFDSAGPGIRSGATAEDLLARGRERADRDFATQPALRIEILALIGDLERRSGHPESARELLEQAALMAHGRFGSTDRRTLHIEYLIAEEADDLGRVRDATSRLQTAVDAFERGPNRESREEVQALAWLAGLDERIGESSKAIDVGQRALAIARSALPDDSAALTEAVLNLGWILLDSGRPASAEPLLREAVARTRSARGDDHPDVADATAILSSALVSRGGYAAGEQLLRDALAMDRRVYARAHPHVAWHLNDLGNVLALEGKTDEAGEMFAKSLAMARELAPSGALIEAVSIGNLARLRYRLKDYQAAESGLREAISKKERLLGADYGDNGRSFDRACLAEVLIMRRSMDEARTLVDGALSEARQRHGEAHPDIAFALMVEAELDLAQGRLDDAHRRAEDAVATYAALSELNSEKVARALALLAKIRPLVDSEIGTAKFAMGAAHSALPSLAKAAK
jgi:eukaryotic-like serine/threonine-protein kinase